MLKIRIDSYKTYQINQGLVELPALHHGQSASITDYTKKGTELLIFVETKEFGYVIRSKAGIHTDLDNGLRIIDSYEKEIERKMEPGQKFMRDIKTKYGTAMLIVEKTYDSNN